MLLGPRQFGKTALVRKVASKLRSETLWLRGGFPESLLAESDSLSAAWRQDFIRSYLERDVPMFAPRMPAQALGRLWTMLAHSQGGLLNQARLAASLGVSAPTVMRYTDLMVDLQLVRRLMPWSDKLGVGSVGKRLVKSPKVYVRDSGIAHALLDLTSLNDVLGHPAAGPSYEGFVIENLIACAAPRFKPYFYRTHDGAEIDLLLETGGKPAIAIEVKRSSAPTLDRGFGTACDDLKIAPRYVVYPGIEAYPLRQGAQTIGLAAMTRALQAD
jgi:uncharacterized protein